MHLPAPGASNLVIALDSMIEKLDNEYVKRGFGPSGLRKRLITYNDDCMITKRKRRKTVPLKSDSVRETLARFDPKKTIDELKGDVKQQMRELDKKIEKEHQRLIEDNSNLRPFDGLVPKDNNQNEAAFRWGGSGDVLRKISGMSCDSFVVYGKSISGCCAIDRGED